MSSDDQPKADVNSVLKELGTKTTVITSASSLLDNFTKRILSLEAELDTAKNTVKRKEDLNKGLIKQIASLEAQIILRKSDERVASFYGFGTGCPSSSSSSLAEEVCNSSFERLEASSPHQVDIDLLTPASLKTNGKSVTAKATDFGHCDALVSPLGGFEFPKVKRDILGSTEEEDIAIPSEKKGKEKLLTLSDTSTSSSDDIDNPWRKDINDYLASEVYIPKPIRHWQHPDVRIEKAESSSSNSIPTNFSNAWRSLSPEKSVSHVSSGSKDSSNAAGYSRVDNFFTHFGNRSFPFDRDAHTDLPLTYRRLCSHFNLPRGSFAEKSAYRSFHDAVISDLENFVSMNKRPMESGADTIFRTLNINGNRNNGVGNFINIYDLLECLRSPEPHASVKRFESLEGLMDYCRRTGRFFPNGFVKKGSCLQSFLNPVSGSRIAFETAKFVSERVGREASEMGSAGMGLSYRRSGRGFRESSWR